MIDPNSIPKRRLTWPAAFRLRPASIPENPFPDSVNGDAEAISELIALCSPVGRYKRALIPLPFKSEETLPDMVLSAFANPAPEWQFAPSSCPHMAVGETVKAALQLGTEQFGQFLKDTDEGPCRLSFVLERYILKGNLHNITDTEVFSSCYDAVDFSVSHQLIRDLLYAGADGLVCAVNAGNCAVVLKPECFSACAQERAVSLEWDGVQFHRYFDYRDLYWADLTS